jgi:hypothetical protein
VGDEIGLKAGGCQAAQEKIMEVFHGVEIDELE